MEGRIPNTRADRVSPVYPRGRRPFPIPKLAAQTVRTSGPLLDARSSKKWASRPEPGSFGHAGRTQMAARLVSHTANRKRTRHAPLFG